MDGQTATRLMLNAASAYNVYDTAGLLRVGRDQQNIIDVICHTLVKRRVTQ